MTEATSTKVVNALTPVFLFLVLLLMSYVFKTLDVDIKPILAIVIALTPLWLPFVLFQVTFDHWMWYTREMFKYNSGRTTLRIKLPQEVLKSPEAMESILTQTFNINNQDNLMQTYLQGKHPLVTSLEIASVDGEVRFYANVPTKKVKNSLEAQLYAQYPGIEVTEELIDYTSAVKWSDSMDLISFHIVKKKDDFFPIKTYIDFGLDKQPKEELKYDPISPLIEHVGKVKPHERIWIQILITPHGEVGFKQGSLSRQPNWSEKARAKIDEMMKRDQDKLGVEETESRPTLTPGERDTISAIERNISKYAYSTAIRAMYITDDKKRFDGDMIGPMLAGFSHFEMIGRNGLGVRWRTDFNYNFLSDLSGQRKRNMKKFELESYKKRFYLHGDNKKGLDKAKIMSVEELASIYHIPGSSVITPNISRVESTRNVAPANLPTELPLN